MKCLWYTILLITIATSKGSKYNVLFIVVDDLRPALGIYNDSNAHTPNIDKLARKSFVFKHAYSQQALCAPSRNSFLTSRRPDTLRLYDFYNYWRDTVGNFTTIPQHFKDNGYVTHSIGKVFHPGISSNRTDDYPLSWSSKPFHPVTETYKNAKVCVNPNGSGFGTNIVCPVRVADQPNAILPDMESLHEGVKFLQGMQTDGKKQPYFLAMGFHKPHIPLKYPRGYLDYHPIDDVTIPRFHDKPTSMPIVAWNPWNDMRLRDDINDLNISFPFGRMPVNYTRKIVQSYSAAVTYVDDLIGAVLKHVNLENTVVVLLGDHGVSMGEHGEFSKYSNFDVATRVPLIIHVPQLTQKPVIVDRVVELLDVFPTLVDLTLVSAQLPSCNRTAPQTLCTEGRSLLDHMIQLRYDVQLGPRTFNDFTASQHYAISQYPRPGVFPTIKPDSDKPKCKQIKIMGYSIRTMDYRYTEWIAFDPIRFAANWTHVYAKELYNHVIDPAENLNIAGLEEMHDVMQTLRCKLLHVLTS